MVPFRRILFEVFCVWCVVGIPIATHAGFVWWAAQTALGFFSAVLDASCSDSGRQNFEELKKFGYSSTTVWVTAAFNLIATNALVAAAHIMAPPSQWEIFSFHTVARIVCSLCITEVLFTLSHAVLHQTRVGAKIHVMHHCCKAASWHVNLVFHPLDMAVEFSGPIMAVFAVNAAYPRALALTVTVVHLWYALDHSALLKLPHTHHHTYTNSMYSIYTNWLFPTAVEKDKVRALRKEVLTKTLKQ